MIIWSIYRHKWLEYRRATERATTPTTAVANPTMILSWQNVFIAVLFAYFVNLAVDITNRQSAINQNRNKYRKLQESNGPSGKALMIEIAKLYQDLPDPKTPDRAEGQYRYWAQNLGLSYFEYYRGRFYTPKEAEGLPHINCYLHSTLITITSSLFSCHFLPLL